MLDVDAYRSRLPYASRKEQPTLYEAFVADRRRLEMKFRTDAICHVGLAGHPKADRAFDFAWNLGHHAGFQEVLDLLEEIADLLIER